MMVLFVYQVPFLQLPVVNGRINFVERRREKGGVERSLQGSRKGNSTAVREQEEDMLKKREPKGSKGIGMGKEEVGSRE